jgi:pentatricopeptide repeat protein
MPPRPFVNDALWRCLCPGFPVNASASAIARIGPPSALRNRPREAHPARQLRAYSHSIASSPYSDDFFSQANAPSSSPRNASQAGVRKPDNKPPLAQLPTYILYEHLRDEGSKGHFDEVFNICRVLIRDRGESPNKEMYNGILHSFVSSSNGTAGKVRKVLGEMGFWADTKDMPDGQAKVELDARGCECVLEALAVHPDYLLRSEILEYMKDRWFPLSPRAQNFVVAGMLRERNFEQALETLDDMINKKIKIESWLFDKAMWILLEFREVEEAFYVLSLKDGIQRKSNGMGSARLSSALWGALLDAAARTQLVSMKLAFNLYILTISQYDATSMVWTTRVQPGYLKPGTGACLSVLAIAARHGDVDLATDVFRVLTERQTVFNTHHYELLIQTYLNADDLSAALSVILIMADSNIKVNAGTCIPLFSYLRKNPTEDSPSRPLHAFNILQDFEASGRKVPTAAVNTCIQASIALDHFEEAIEIYKALHTVSKSGPDTQTFNILFQGCSKNARKELAMFFANEMISLNLRPDRLTYDRLISVCLQSDNLEDALLYYEEMRSTPVKPGSSQKMQPRKRTWEALIQRCVDKGDDRAVATLKDYKQFEEEPKKFVEVAVLRVWGKAKESSEVDGSGAAS